jgi:ABC-type multidrug transport system fused ATPase/permease subunit
MSFFDTTPVGRIVCRFSNDVAKIDNEIIYQFKDSLISVAAVTCNAVIICTGTPHFLFILVPMTLLYFFVQVNNFILKISNKIAFYGYSDSLNRRRRDNTMTNRKRTNNRLQHITQKTKDRAARTPLKTRDEFI